MKKKIITSMLVISMFCGMLAGCGMEKGSTENKVNGTNSTTSETNTEELDYVELTWYYRSESYPDQEAVFKKANEIIKEEINATVNFVPIAPADYEQKMQTKYASGDAGDINWTSSWTNVYSTNVSKGAFYEMDELLEEYAPKLKAFITEDQWEALKINGKIYGIPNAQIFARSGIVTIRKDIAEKYGLDITTVNKLGDLTSFLEEVCAAENLVFERYSKTAGWPGVYIPYGFDDISAYAYVKVDDESLTVVNPYKTEEFAAYCAESKEWAEKGIIANDAMVKQNMDTEIKANKLVGRARGTYKPGVEISELSLWAPGVEIVATMLGEKAILTTSGITATINAIPATSKNPERAMMFLELVNNNKELYNLLCYGIEGQHYEKLDDNTIRQTAADKYQGVTWVIGNTFNGYVLEGMPSTVNEETIELNNTATPSVALGFTFNSDPVKTQIAQVQTVVDEYLPALNCGAVDDVTAAIEEFNTKLEAAGINEIVAEAQAQINEWKATK